MAVSGICRMGGRKGSGFPVSETAQSWNPSSPSFRLHAPWQWAPLSLPFIRTKQGNILKVAAKIKYLKCLASYRYSVNSPLFTYGFCHKDSCVILSGIPPQGMGWEAEVAERVGGWVTCEKCGPAGRTSHPGEPADCGAGDRPAQRLRPWVLVQAAGRRAGRGQASAKEGNNRTVIIPLLPRAVLQPRPGSEPFLSLHLI